jgi:hypothetical protein
MADEYLPFTDFRVVQYSPALSLEEGIKRCLALAGLHSHDFQDEISESGTSLANFDTGGATGTWSVESDQLKGVGGGAASTFYILQHNTEVDPSFVVAFKKSGAKGGVTLLGDEYVVSWNATQTAVSSMSSGQIDTVLSVQDVVLVDDAEVIVAVQFQCMNNFDEVDWVSISVHQNGRCIVGGSDWIRESWRAGGSSFDGQIGLATYESETCYFYDIRVPELKWVREWTSVDPSEPVGAGLSRVIGTTPLFYFARFDGTVRAWIPSDRDVDWAIPDGRVTRAGERENFFVPGHIRMVGAYHEATAVNQTMMEEAARGLYTMPNDPNLMTTDEAQAGADRAHRVMRERRKSIALAIPANPLIEPYDRVTYGAEDKRVSGVQLRMSMPPGKPPDVEMDVDAQDYIEEGS